MRITSFLRTATCLAGVAVSTIMAPWTSAAEPTAVSFQQVIDYLNLEVKEEKILKMLGSSPTMFTLGAEQVQQLQEAGASERLLAAMQKPGATLGADSSDIRDFVFILDCSGSMKDLAEPGVTKWDAAQRAAIDLVTSVPTGRRLAMIVYGHDLSRRCGAVDLVRELAAIDAEGKRELIALIQDLQPSADTPIGASLNLANNLLRKTDQLAKVVMITDGIETCSGDPTGEAAELAAMKHLTGGVDVIGFGLKREEALAIAKIAKAGRGEFFNAETVGKLTESVQSVSRKIATTQRSSGLSPIDALLIKKLKSSESTVRAEAAKKLGERKVAAATTALAEALTSESWEGDVYIGTIFWQTDPSKYEALESLKLIDMSVAKQSILKNLKAKNFDLRNWSVKQAAEMKLVEASATLQKIVASPEWNPGKYIGSIYYTSDANKVNALEALFVLDSQGAQDALLIAAESENADLSRWALDKLAALEAASPQ